MKVIATGKRAKWESEKQDLQPQIQAQEAVVADLKGVDPCSVRCGADAEPQSSTRAPSPFRQFAKFIQRSRRARALCTHNSSLLFCARSAKKEVAEAEQKRIDEEKRKAREVHKRYHGHSCGSTAPACHRPWPKVAF